MSARQHCGDCNTEFDLDEMECPNCGAARCPRWAWWALGGLLCLAAYGLVAAFVL